MNINSWKIRNLRQHLTDIDQEPNGTGKISLIARIIPVLTLVIEPTVTTVVGATVRSVHARYHRSTAQQTTRVALHRTWRAEQTATDAGSMNHAFVPG